MIVVEDDRKAGNNERQRQELRPRTHHWSSLSKNMLI